MGAISLDYAAPEGGLKEFISVFYEFRADVPVFDDLERADLAQLRFLLSDGPGEYSFADGHSQAAPRIQIVGPTTGMTRIRVEGPVHVFGAGLLPAGWASLMGFEASTVLNRVLDATDLFGKTLHQVADQLRAAGSLDERVAIASALTSRLADNARELPFWFTRTVDTWLDSALSPEVADLIGETGLSRRQVERYCKRFYGAPPKVLARKYRALRAAVALAKGEADLDSLLEAGFYDQSHFIREIKQFTGITPKKIADDLPTLARLTLKRSDLAGQVGPLITDT